MDGSGLVETLLRRDQRVALMGLCALTGLAWAYLLTGAGMEMSVADMTTTALFPHTDKAASGMLMAQSWSLAHAALIAAMWWVMMIAMMTPSAAPAVLLYGRVARHAQSGRLDDRAASEHTAIFFFGYVLVWLAFSVIATAAQRALEGSGLLSAISMWSTAAWLSGGVLILAGMYQWTPLKTMCLRHCQAPARFVSRYWRPGRSGAFLLGARHGAYCVGCCWALMALLFVGGVMNPIWIAALALMVLAEKLVSRGPWLPRVSGGLLIVWGIATIMI